MKKTRLFIWFLIALFAILAISGCSRCSGKRRLPSGIEKVHISRYERALFTLNPGNLKEGLRSISKDYSFFIGEGYNDTLNLVQIHDFITDPSIQILYETSEKIFPDFSGLEKQLETEFYYYKENLPAWKYPRVYSYVSGLLYEYPVQYYDSVLIIALDMYLGEGFEPYRQLQLPHYKVRRMSKEYIAVDCAREIATAQVRPGMNNKALLDYMVYQGKIMYLMDLVLPEEDDTLKTGYTGKQLEWCKKNEGSIWAFLLENQLLFSSDIYKIQKFIQDGPFTSGLSNDSPGMLGKWLGWRIVTAYMKKTHSSLENLLEEKDSQMILNRSGYKPKR
jgi:hypothetical protein